MNRPSQSEYSLRKVVYACGFVSVLLALALSRTRAGEWLESGSFDVRARWTADPGKADSRIVIIDVDNASFSVLQEKLGRWPWPRSVWTEVIRYISRGNPSAVAVDIVFSGQDKSDSAIDPEFARVLKSSGKTVLGFAFMSSQLTGEDDESRRQHQKFLEEHGARLGFGPGLSADEWLPHLPLDSLAANAAAVGSLNSTPDQGGMIRRTPVQFQFNGLGYPTLGAMAAQIARGENSVGEWHRKSGVFDYSYLERRGKRVPLDEEGRVALLWRGESLHAFPRLPIWEVICSIYREQCPNAEHFYAPEYFSGKVVLLGASAAASYEPRPTPLDPQAPGFMVHATLIDNLLSGEALRLAPTWVLAIAVLLMGFIGGALQIRLPSIGWGLGVLAGVLLLYFAGSVYVFSHHHFVLPVVAPGLALIFAHGSASAARYATTGKELRQTRRVLERYVAPQLVDYVMSNLNALQLSGSKRELTILISDVRNFTTMTEKADPEELIHLLNDYLEAMTEIIFKYNGIVDKFIGDGILAYWGAFTPEKNHAEEAALAALEMMDKLKLLNEQWKQQGKEPIAIGIGINTGKVVFGNIGKGKKIEFTVIGDAVNLAARLESLNKEFKTSIVIGEETCSRLGNKMDVRCLGGVKVKGKTIETQVYELRGRANSPFVPPNCVEDAATVPQDAGKQGEQT